VNLAGRIDFTVGPADFEDRARNQVRLRIDGRIRSSRRRSRSLLLYEIVASVSLWAVAAVRPCAALRRPAASRFTILEENSSGAGARGQLTGCPRSRRAWSLISAGSLEHLQINVAVTPLGNPSGEIYGKVVESVDGAPSRVKIGFRP